ncbi:MAG: hypothetical protein L6R48_03905, partial [Planctomycetes bacterium]|nr:hypothetical protein [Planctomycetota bacterium]
KDLGEGGRALAARRELLPTGHGLLPRTEADLAQARARAEAARRAAEELEARRAKGARELLESFEDLRRPLPELEAALAAYLAEAGERPEKPLL